MTAPGLMARLRAQREPRGFTAALFVLSCVPALMAIGAMASDLTRGTRFFGSDPIKEGEHFIGLWTLRFLIFTLMITPIRQLLGWNWTAKHRRTLGLFAFSYALLHWLTYAFLDVQLDFKDLLADVAKRPYILIGTLALLLLLPLAVTSTTKMIQRLGGKRWNLLHMLIFPACVLGVIHFWMAVKADISDPLLFASIFGALFAYRIWKWRERRTPRSA